MDIDGLGRLSFQVDFDALRDVRTRSYDLRDSTVDIRFPVTGGSGYSSMAIPSLGSDTSYSVGNEFGGSFLIQRNTVYYLRTEFHADGDYTRRLSATRFGDSDVRLFRGSLAESGLFDRIVRVNMNNSRNSSTTLRVDFVGIRGGTLPDLGSGGGGTDTGSCGGSGAGSGLDTAWVRLTNAHGGGQYYSAVRLDPLALSSQGITWTNVAAGHTSGWTTIEFDDANYNDPDYRVQYNTGSGWITFAFETINMEAGRDCTVSIVGGGPMQVIAQPSVTCN